MKVILFGASGMVGQGALRECLLDPEVESVLSIVRAPGDTRNPKLRELVHSDFTDFASVADLLAGYDACFFCLGTSSAGVTEAAYRKINHDFPLAAAKVLAARNPGMTFVYVSGTGADSTERGSVMWARVKGETENALLKLAFKGVYLFRPGIIRPLDGIQSKTRLYRLLYPFLTPFYPLLGIFAPRLLTSTRKVGRAMLNAAKRGAPKPHLENGDINALAG